MKSTITDYLYGTNANSIAKELEATGYCVIENAITDEAIQKILDEAEDIQSRGAMNVNDIQMVDYHGQKFISHTLASMFTVSQLITDQKFLDISRHFLGNHFRLKAQRYYESGQGYQLGWHVDNKTVNNVKTKTRGLVFIIYLVDTYDGQLEVIRGSNKWSGDLAETSFADDQLMKFTQPDDYLSLPGKRGTLVITDIYTIHRTKKITTDFKRKSIFFQIDDDMEHSEKIIINPEFFPIINPQLHEFLGFGRPSGYQIMPGSSVRTLSSKEIIKNFLSLVQSSLRRVFLIK